MTGPITFATPQDWEQLEEMWQICFGEAPEVLAIFHRSYFEPENCLVYRVDNRIAAMVHMLPARIATADSFEQAHYIYAAATLPEHRSKGYMGKLLHCAAEAGLARGDKYSLLLPSEPSLYGYYSIQGYDPKFKIRLATLSRTELVTIVKGGQPENITFTAPQLERIRNDHLASNPGSVLWGQKAIAYAVANAQYYGGRIIGAQAEGEYAYALCAGQCGQQCEVIELMARPATLPALLTNLLAAVPAHSFTFRLPAYSSIFAELGETVAFGMVKSLDATAPPIFAHGPYLGLTLD